MDSPVHLNRNTDLYLFRTTSEAACFAAGVFGPFLGRRLNLGEVTLTACRVIHVHSRSVEGRGGEHRNPGLGVEGAATRGAILGNIGLREIIAMAGIVILAVVGCGVAIVARGIALVGVAEGGRGLLSLIEPHWGNIGVMPSDRGEVKRYSRNRYLVGASSRHEEKAGEMGVGGMTISRRNRTYEREGSITCCHRIIFLVSHSETDVRSCLPVLGSCPRARQEEENLISPDELK